MTGVVVRLDPEMFEREQRRLVAFGSVTVSTFRYRSGIEGLRLENGVGVVDVLPFIGQQLWRAEFHGRPLTMRSTFDEPVATTDYLANNGAYFVHCGGSAMGNPGESDGHPLHGELPNARHRDVELIADPAAGTITVRGGFSHRVSFGPYFSVRTSVTLTDGSSLMDSRAEITNLSGEPRPLMYLAHINFRPAVDGVMVETLAAPLRTRADFDLGSGAGVRRVSAADADAVTAADLLAPGAHVEPEVVQTVPLAPDPDGWVHSRQRHADGSTDLVSHDTAHLSHTLRWLRRSADDDAFGFALPATAEADGFEAEQLKGHVRHYAPGELLVAQIRHGIEPPHNTHEERSTT